MRLWTIIALLRLYLKEMTARSPTKSFPEIVALMQLFPKIGSSSGFPLLLPLLLRFSVWWQKYVNKWEAVLVCSALRLFSIFFFLPVFTFFSWGTEAHAIRGGTKVLRAPREENL